jgi:hypothetical protein
LLVKISAGIAVSQPTLERPTLTVLMNVVVPSSEG